MLKKFGIFDWANNRVFAESFNTFDEGWDFLFNQFRHLSEDEADIELGEFSVLTIK